MTNKTTAQIEQELWVIFDNATMDSNGNKLNRNTHDTETDGHSRRHYHFNRLTAEVAKGNWTPNAEAEVHVCVRKAGATARIIADALKENNCTLRIFNMACLITKKSFDIDQGGGAGIIC